MDEHRLSRIAALNLLRRIERNLTGEVSSASKTIALTQDMFYRLISYLKLGGFPVGLLINFNVVHLRDGIKRVCPQGSRQLEE
jgi:hypothetical protein